MAAGPPARARTRANTAASASVDEYLSRLEEPERTDELRDFDVSGRTIRFPAKKPLPAALVKRIVKARVLENEARVED